MRGKKIGSWGSGDGSLFLVLAKLCHLPLMKQKSCSSLRDCDLFIVMHKASCRKLREVCSLPFFTGILSALLGQLYQSRLVNTPDNEGGHLIEGLADFQIQLFMALLYFTDLQDIALMMIEFPHGLQLALLQIPNLWEILLFNQLFKVQVDLIKGFTALVNFRFDVE